MAEVRDKFKEYVMNATPKGLLSVLGESGFEKRLNLLWAFFKKREGEISIRYERFDGGYVVETLMDDRPFLVDTVELNLRKMGIPYRVLIHPIIYSVRDENGNVVDIDEDRGTPESLIHVEIPEEVSEDKVKEFVSQLEGIFPLIAAMVSDFVRMKKKVREGINDLEFYMEFKRQAVEADMEELEENVMFLEWLLDENFVFFGYGEASGNELLIKEGKGLGILRKEFILDVFLDFSEVKETLSSYPDDTVVIVDKLSVDSPIHRTGKLDIIASRIVLEDGSFGGWRFWIGLFTKKAVGSKGEDIPLLRKKLVEIISRRKLIAGSHDYKKVIAIFNSIPIEELFTSTTDEINEIISMIVEMGHEKALDVYVRKKKKGLISILVILPEEKFSRAVADNIKNYLMEKFKATYVDERFAIYEERIAFLYFFLTPLEDIYIIDTEQIKREIETITAEWEDILKDELKKKFKSNWESVFFKYVGAFTIDYKASVSPQEAVEDIQAFEEIYDNPDEIKVIIANKENHTCIKIYTSYELKLSDTVPIMENFYFTVWDEKPYDLKFPSGKTLYLHVFRVVTRDGTVVDESVHEKLEDAFVAVMKKKAESDPLNSLVIKAGLDWKSADILRTYRNYVRQIVPSIAYSTAYAAFQKYPHIVKLLWDYFDKKFNPDLPYTLEQRKEILEGIEKTFYEELAKVENISEDKAFRTYFNAIKSTIRTNFYKNRSSHYISIKIDCSQVAQMPHPRPMYEIYVHEWGMEGVHLRGGKIARGGIRWSDRVDDFRTEILGLMNTQMIKNAIIVPVGAKGGFIIKLRKYKTPLSYQELDALVKRKYRIFIQGLLDITDNIVDGKVIPPERVVRYDEDDPYLVVAADKGTAKLSDVANEIAQNYGFWLSDAFASGGSTGYDHKKMGVTAKGAWVCVRRHFMEMGIDPEKDVITAVGIGDMSGDVFGNGLLRSRTIKLIAAFNHRVIFLDPDPDPEVSYKERERLFKEALDWDHYNPDLISKGGGVFRRDAKSIKLSEEARRALGTDKEEVSGEELIKLILKAPVDLLWNGGIGTYVKASSETHQEVGDPANDNVRVDANELRVKVVGEGGNLGFTQKARVEYAAGGGRINMDAIDNSGGVDTSDHEVNIKILLSEPVKKGELTIQERNKLIFDIADEVLKDVMYDNYRQSLAISLDVIRSKRDIKPFQGVIATLIDDGFIDPNEVYIPSKKELRSRAEKGIGLYRPELSLLIGYQKRWVKENLRGKDLIRSEFLNELVYEYFPDTLKSKFGKYIPGHPLRDEIALTSVVNSIVDQAGISIFYKMMRDHDATVEEITSSYLMMERVLDAKSLRNRIYSLDFKVDTDMQYRALIYIEDTIEQLVKWSLYFKDKWDTAEEAIAGYREKIKYLIDNIALLVPEERMKDLEKEKMQMIEAGFPEEIASSISIISYLSNAMDIITLSDEIGINVEDVLKAYHLIEERFGISYVEFALSQAAKETDWDSLAYSMLHKDIYEVRRKLVKKFVESGYYKDWNIEEFYSKAVPGWLKVEAMLSKAEKEKNKNLSVWSVIVRRMKEAVF